MFNTKIAVAIAEVAGQAMLKHFGDGFNNRYLLKDDRTPVTDTELAINAMVRDRIRENYPDFSVNAEEGSALIEGARYTVMVDDVDGTFCFTTGSPTSAFSFALVDGKMPEYGLIYDPFMKRMYRAKKGEGAFCNGARIRVSKQKEITDAKLCMMHWRGSQWHVDRMIRRVEKMGGNWTNPVSASYYCGLVAMGLLDGVVFPASHPRETAAAKVIIEEAGGIVTDFDGQPHADLSGPPIRGMIAANPVLHKKLVAIAKDVNRPRKKKQVTA